MRMKGLLRILCRSDVQKALADCFSLNLFSVSGFCLTLVSLKNLTCFLTYLKAYGSIKVGSWWEAGKMPKEKNVCFNLHYINVCFNNSISMISIESNATLKVIVQKQ